MSLYLLGLVFLEEYPHLKVYIRASTDTDGISRADTFILFRVFLFLSKRAGEKVIFGFEGVLFGFFRLLEIWHLQVYEGEFVIKHLAVLILQLDFMAYLLLVPVIVKYKV